WTGESRRVGAACSRGARQSEEAADTRHDVKGSGAWACTAHLTGGEGDSAVREADEAWVGDGDSADRGGAGCAGGVSVVIGPPLDMPGDGPDLWVDVLQQSGWAHVFFEESAGDG